MKSKLLLYTAVLLTVAACGTTKKASENHYTKDGDYIVYECDVEDGTIIGRAEVQKAEYPGNGKVAVIAHRGFWNCEAGGHAQNSVAALKAAQDAGFWGSEFDVQLTKDSVVVSNHDKEYGPDKWKIIDHTYDQLKAIPLPNGETLPTLEDYLLQGKQSDKTVLVLEVKPQKTVDLTLFLVDKTMEIVKEVGLYDPTRICFISFSKDACLHLAKKHPAFAVQYLNGNMSSKALQKHKLNGADYYQQIYFLEPGLVNNLHKRGLKANVWTVDNDKKMRRLFDKGIDQLTTNDPMKAREILGEKELRR